MAPRFELRTLGGAVLLGPEGPVRGRAAHRRRLALLALLSAVSGRTLGRERILGYLWPDQPSDAGRHQLSEALYVLRKAVGEGAFVSAGDEVGLDPAVIGSDVGAFRDAVDEGRFLDAVELYRGPFLDGFYVSDAPDFERWTDEVRADLAGSLARALEALAAGCEEVGDPRGAAGWLRRLAAHDPYSSRIALRLMRALADADERAAALMHASVHAAFLREELGVDPDPAIAELARRLASETVALPRLEPAPRPAEERFEPMEPPAVDGPPAAAEGAAEEDGARANPHPHPAAAPSTDGARRLRSPSFAARAAGYLGASLLGALLIVAILRLVPTAGAASSAEPTLDPRRIAVLYFDDHSPGQELAHLAGGLTEGLIHELSAVPVLDVVSRGGVKPFRLAAAPTDSIARRLLAGSVVEGSVQRWGDRVRVTVHLVEGATGRQLESQTLEHPAGDLFALQDDLARRVARILRTRLGEEVRLRERERGTASAAAMELVLLAEQRRADARTVGASAHPRDSASARTLLREADSLLARAAGLDRRWTEPPLLRGWTRADRARLLPPDAAREELDAGLRYAGQVLALDPRSARGLELRGTLAWLGVVLDPAVEGTEGRLAAAERDLRAALREDPALANAWATLSQFLRFRGDVAESERAAARALEVDAYLEDAPVIVERLYRSALSVAELGRARHWCERGHRDHPDDWRFAECRLALLARDSSVAPEVRAAEAILAEAERLDPRERAEREGRGYTPIHRRMVYAAVLARAERGDSARATVARAWAEVRDAPEWRASFHYDEAFVWLLLGVPDEAARALREVTEHRPHLREYLARDPLFRTLGGAP